VGKYDLILNNSSNSLIDKFLEASVLKKGLNRIEIKQ
jgi:hypothetical protein